MEVIKRLLQKDLDSLIAQADVENWSQLALIGPNVRVRSVEDLPEPLRTSDNVFRLAAFDEALTNKLLSLTNLTSLTLWGNDIGDQGAQALAALTNLASLDLWRNRIGDQGAQALATLTNLASLNLRENDIGDQGAQALATLTNLSSLNLRGNDIGDQGAQALAALTNLSYLELGYNHIGDQGARALATLTNLSSLDLGSNGIGDQGAQALAALTNLSSLNLRNNKLSDISFLRALKRLTTLGLSENLNLKEPPEKIIQEGLEAIRNYFDQIEKQGIDHIFEAKVLFVGEPGAGKTSLMKKLQDPAYPVPNPEPEQSTLGIAIVPDWTFPFTEDPTRAFKAHLWDFGGQNIQYYIHQFFLTERSLYLLVVDDRKDYPNIDYWFNIIKLLGKDSPILLIRNEKDIEATVGFDRVKYETRYQELDIAFYDVNLAKGGHRLEVIDEKVKEKLCKLEHVGDSVPKNWIGVRADLAARKSGNHIALSEFKAICARHEITHDQDQTTLLGYLHALGILLNYKNDSGLRDYVFLNPQWIIDAVYTILSDKTLEKQQGRFSVTWLFDRWGTHYSDEEKDKLLLLMQKREFDLCYRLEEQGEENYLAPQLLQDVAPKEANVWDRRNTLCFRYSYEFMPIGIITRIIVRLSEWIAADLVWRSGVILTKDACEALVKDDIKEGHRVIDISVRGNAFTRRDFLSLIRGAIDGIHKQSFEHVNVEPLVPCNCEVCDGSDDPMFFGWHRLQNYLEAGRNTITCEKGKQFRDIPIGSMLEGFLSRRERDEGRFEESLQPIPLPVEKPSESSAKDEKNILFKDWWVLSIVAGLSTVILTAILIPDSWNWWNWRFSVISGLVIAALMLINNPEKRYMKAFWVVLSVLTLWNMLPGLGVTMPGFELLIKGLDWPVNLGLIGLLGYLLRLDFLERRKTS